MDVRRLLIFRTVARSGSISGAARELGWTQPAVSQHLRALERAAGCALLLRGAGGVTLTEPGEALLVRADAVAQHVHLAEEQLAEFTALRRGRVRLAAYPSAAATLVPRTVASLRVRFPHVDVELGEAEPPEALRLVRSGDADVALVFGYDGESLDSGDLSWVPLGAEPVSLVLPATHRLAHRARLAVRDLADEDWIVGCVRCRAHALAVCAAAGVEPRVRHATDDYVVVQNLVAVGLGVSLLPRSALEAYRHPGVAVRESRSFGTRTFGAVHREGAEQVPAAAALLSELRHPTPLKGRRRALTP